MLRLQMAARRELQQPGGVSALRRRQRDRSEPGPDPPEPTSSRAEATTVVYTAGQLQADV